MAVFLGANPLLRVIGSRRYEYIPDLTDPFRMVDGKVTIMLDKPFETDGGTIPRQLWWIAGLGHFDYLPAYLIHDWEFIQAHIQKKDYPFTLTEVNKRLIRGIECINALNNKSRYLQRKLIYLACQYGGRLLWEGRR